MLQALATQVKYSHGKLQTIFGIGKMLLLVPCATFILIETVLATKRKCFTLASNPSTIFPLGKVVFILSEQRKIWKTLWKGRIYTWLLFPRSKFITPLRFSFSMLCQPTHRQCCSVLWVSFLMPQATFVEKGCVECKNNDDTRRCVGCEVVLRNTKKISALCWLYPKVGWDELWGSSKLPDLLLKAQFW